MSNIDVKPEQMGHGINRPKDYHPAEPSQLQSSSWGDFKLSHYSPTFPLLRHPNSKLEVAAASPTLPSYREYGSEIEEIRKCMNGFASYGIVSWEMASRMNTTDFESRNGVTCAALT